MIVPVPKCNKRGNRVLKDFRSIALINTFAKVLDTIVVKRLEVISDDENWIPDKLQHSCQNMYKAYVRPRMDYC